MLRARVYMVQFSIWGGNRPGRCNGDEGTVRSETGTVNCPQGGDSRDLPSGGLEEEFTVTAERGEE